MLFRSVTFGRSVVNSLSTISASIHRACDPYYDPCGIDVICYSEVVLRGLAEIWFDIASESRQNTWDIGGRKLPIMGTTNRSYVDFVRQCLVLKGADGSVIAWSIERHQRATQTR